MSSKKPNQAPAKASKGPCGCNKQGEKKSTALNSPINLGDDAKPGPNNLKEPFNINGLEKMLCTEIVNTHRQIMLRVCPKQSPVITGGGLSHAEYIIDRIDFHWCSEHTINGSSCPLETHILMHCTEFSSIDEALEKEGAAMLSVLHEFSDITSCGITKLIPYIAQIRDSVDKPVPYCVVTLKDFIPEEVNNYYRYTGSETCSPHRPGLEWTVFKQKLPITRMDLACFTKIHDGEGHLIVSNNRELQPVPPGAEIYLFTDGKDCSCGSKK